MKKKRKKELIASWMEHRFLTSNWKWKSEDHKQAVRERLYKKIDGVIQGQKGPGYVWIRPILLAASVMLVGAVLFYFYSKPTFETIMTEVPMAEAVMPGTNAATLTLEDGTVINLDEAGNGILAQKENAVIKKENDGQLIYEGRNGTGSGATFMNTLTVPRGGLFQVVLPDGSQVWLNAASVLSYPSQFTGNERRVRLVGEAYFVIAHNTEKPFRLSVGDAEIEVTGTTFNVSAYSEDRRVVTTLLEGGVTVRKDNRQMVLKPGQQSVSSPDAGFLKVEQVDTEIATAWKSGYFIFDDQDIEAVLREVARWYNVEIAVKNESRQKKTLGGVFSREKSIDELLVFLGRLKVGKFERNGRRVAVTI